MKNIGKGKILKIVICALCVLIFASAFLAVRRWLHSEGLHFIIGYGQIHLSKMCEGIDQDGNKIEPRNVVIDGVVTKDWKSEDFWKLDGEVDIVDGLPEDVFPSKGGGIVKLDDGFYFVTFIFPDFPKDNITSGYESLNDGKDNRIEDKSCFALVWIKNGEIVMKFYQGADDTNGYYIYYSDIGMLDIEMLDIEQIQAKLNKDIK
ncbi:MAG: hypothetical protein HFH67_05740 [Lachnospiraceae bacterium]|nr:hypothetical protein [Lachnospiraceae bacterium]